jgi:hypothetical protein
MYSCSMKRNLIAFILLLVCSEISYAQYSGISFGAVYEKVQAGNNEKYLAEISARVHAAKPFDLSEPVGGAFYFTTKPGKSGEMEVGISMRQKSATLRSDSGLYLRLTNRYVGLHFGGNYYPTRWLFVGGQFVVNNFSGVVKYEDPKSDSLFEFTPDDINIFKGYFVGIRPQAGFSIPFTSLNSRLDTGLRLLAYYDMGLSRYNFHGSYDKIMDYNGEKKTFCTGYGVEVTYYLRFAR